MGLIQALHRRGKPHTIFLEEPKLGRYVSGSLDYTFSCRDLPAKIKQFISSRKLVELFRNE